jgi:hypothetical protein
MMEQMSFAAYNVDTSRMFRRLSGQAGGRTTPCNAPLFLAWQLPMLAALYHFNFSPKKMHHFRRRLLITEAKLLTSATSFARAFNFFVETAYDAISGSHAIISPSISHQHRYSFSLLISTRHR